MVKKKGAASKPKDGPVPTPAVKEAALEEPAADGVMQVLNRRFRAARKKIQKISYIEEAQAGGKEINDDQVKTLESKVQVNAILEELARVEPLVEKALKKEIDVAVAKALEEAKVANEASEAEDGASSTLDSSEPKAEADEAGQILDLLYVSQVFGVGGSEVDYQAFLAGEESSEGNPVTRQDLEKMAEFGKSLFTRSVEEGFTHEEALNRCKTKALTFIRSPDALVDSETSVAEMMDLITKLKDSDFFKMELAPPTQAEVEPESVVAPPAEDPAPDPVPEIDPAVHAPPMPAETAAVGHVPDPHIQSESPPEPYNPVMAGSQPAQQQQQASGVGGPRPFLPFSSLGMPLSMAPPVSPPTFSGQMPVNSMAFGVPNSGAPGGYMRQQGVGYGSPAPQHPHSDNNMPTVSPPRAPEVEPQTVVEPEMVSPPQAEALLQHPPQAHQDQSLDMKSPPIVPPQDAPKHLPAHHSEQAGLEARPRGPGSTSRRPRNYDGQGGPPRHGGGMGGPYGGGRGPSHGWGGYNNNYGGGGYRGGSSWDGRGRGRGRSGGPNYGGGDGGYGGRGPAPNSYQSRGGGRGRGGFRGGRGGGPWNRPPPHFAQQPQGHT